MSALLELLRQAPVRTAMYRCVCCPPQLAFAGLFGSCREASTWRTIRKSNAICDHALVEISTLFAVGATNLALLQAHQGQRRPDEQSYVFYANSPLFLSPAQAAALLRLRRALEQRLCCHAVVYFDPCETFPTAPVYETVAALRRRHGTRLRVTIVTGGWTSAQRCDLLLNAVVAVTHTLCLPRKSQSKSQSVLRALDQGRIALLFLNYHPVGVWHI